MHLIIENKAKLEVFVAIFQLLKNWSSHISMHFESDRLHIQSIDKSHICLANIEIKDKWFTLYECLETNNISVDSGQMAILMNYALKHEKIELKYNESINADKLCVNMFNVTAENKNSFEHLFELNLVDIDEGVEVDIPKSEYDVEFTINSKKIIEVFSELNSIGPDLNIKCSDTVVELNANGDSTKLKVNIPVDDLDEYAISEGDEMDIAFSLSHLCKMCLSMKLSATINISISNELPMTLVYDLGEDSKVTFYVAPKMSDK